MKKVRMFSSQVEGVRVYEYNGSTKPCAYCCVRPGSQHKMGCHGGTHDLAHHESHEYKGYSDGSACYVCGHAKRHGVHLKHQHKD